MNNAKFLFTKKYKDIMRIPHVIENDSIKFNESKMSLPLEVLEEVVADKIKVDVRDGDYIYEFENEKTGEKELYVIPEEIVEEEVRVFQAILKSVDLLLRDEDTEFVSNPFVSGITNKKDNEYVMTDDLMRAGALGLILDVAVTESGKMIVVDVDTSRSKPTSIDLDELEGDILGLTISRFMIDIAKSATLNLVKNLKEPDPKILELVQEDVFIYDDTFNALYADDYKSIYKVIATAPNEVLDQLFDGVEYYEIELFDKMRLVFMTPENIEIIDKNIVKRAKELDII